MSDVPRPDLSRILPVPRLRQLASPALPFADAPHAPASAELDYLVDVRHREKGDADAAGFGIAQARAVAARIGAKLRGAGAHALDPSRVERLLAPFVR